MAKPMPREEFLRRAAAVHGNTYDYSKADYRNMQTKVCIVCRKHGEFWQLPQPHLRGQGCPVCGDEKQRRTIMARYGVDNPMKAKAVQDKARATCMERYGHAWAMSSSETRAKVTATSRMKYGTDRPQSSDVVREKIKATLRARYGTENIMTLPEIKAKARRTCLKRYGTEEPLAAPEVREKIRATNMARYGGTAPMASSEVRARCMATNVARYGVPYVVQTSDVVRKTRESKAARGTFGTSESEEVLYSRLRGVFGSDDVVRQYKSDRYPFACDFYIKSRDMYIELNAAWTHGGHWFAPDDGDDASVLQLWTERGTKYYLNAIHTWTVADVRKRDVARANGLNYIVFWDSRLRDAELWLEAGCPDGRDWDVPCSWFSE